MFGRFLKMGNQGSALVRNRWGAKIAIIAACLCMSSLSFSVVLTLWDALFIFDHS